MARRGPDEVYSGSVDHVCRGGIGLTCIDSNTAVRLPVLSRGA
jgi:hypothetical protein